jgi:hypothetical protein
MHKKEPITPEILKQIVTKYGTVSSNLKDLRLVTMCLICYAGFLRFSELVNQILMYMDCISSKFMCPTYAVKNFVYRTNRFT